VAEEIEEVLQIDAADAIRASAKAGIGIKEVLESIVKNVPPPNGVPDAPLRALIFDSHFDSYLGVVAYIRVVDGEIKAGTTIKMMAIGKTFEVTGVGTFNPRMRPSDTLGAGEVGYMHASIKSVSECRVGDTITLAQHGAKEPLLGYKQAKPMVFCGLYPIEA
jgi:GTP-binding protein LepA